MLATRKRVICALPNKLESIEVVDERGYIPIEQFALCHENYEILPAHKLEDHLKSCDSYGKQRATEGKEDAGFHMSCFDCPYHKEYKDKDAVFELDQQDMLHSVSIISSLSKNYSELLRISARMFKE